MAQIYISIGSNIEKEINIIKGLNALRETFGPLSLSSLFESESIGFDGPVFYNMVVGASTHLPLEDLAITLRDIEFAHGRDFDAVKNSPRTLDLDLLLYDNLVTNDPVQLPREEITRNAFVLWPLAELAPMLKHPVTNQSYQALWQAYDKTTQQLRKVPLNWQ